MMEWLSKRRGAGGPSKKEQDNADGVTSFAQIKQRDRVKCRSCGNRGHFADECPNISEEERARIIAASSRRRVDDGSVGSNTSYRSDSQSSLDSRSSGNASRNDRRSGRRSPTPRTGPTPPRGRRSVFEQAHFAFTSDRLPGHFS